MRILPVRTRLLSAGDDLAQIIAESVDLEPGDIIVVSSKVAATAEGASVKLSDLTPSVASQKLLADYKKSPEHREFLFREIMKMNGSVIRTTESVVLTELKPDGLDGSLLVPNAGIDESNIEKGWIIGWPKDPVETVRKLRASLSKHLKCKKGIAVILSDSGLSPRRSGVTAFALTVAGIDPLHDRRGTLDLFDREMLLTVEAVADQLATAANFVMGNADESTPAAVIRDHGLALSDFEGWVPGIERERDIYNGIV